ncbi:hypothetical protein CDL15_Pgr011495 [Punica granatum]|uniref:Uncharacterized protein n=1 Tax=Punica granatum TaxID=22663 RepID=A0A218VVK1_PUNGR|nr:hypothetical protein CDL15_Pgr011495 [Punica granatum]
MSKSLNPSGFQVTETAPPSLLRVERRLSFGRVRLETIEEEGEGQSQGVKISTPTSPFGSSCKANIPMQSSPSMAGR